MMVSSGGTTKRLDRLEAKGLIRRAPDPNDRRGTLVTLTDTGRATIDTIESDHVQNETQLLAPLPKDERDRLTNY
jgi:DNA-binding MarR family transcriptional regulator